MSWYPGITKKNAFAALFLCSLYWIGVIFHELNDVCFHYHVIALLGRLPCYVHPITMLLPCCKVVLCVIVHQPGKIISF